MQLNFIIASLGGLCYAHGPYRTQYCPKWPKCATDPKHVEFMELADLSEDEIEEILGAERDCVCTTHLSQVAYCDKCLGDNEVGRRHQELERLNTEVIQQAKDFFGSVDRTDTRDLLSAVGELLVFENEQS